MASEKKNSNKLNFLNWILAIAIVLFFALLIIYYFNIFDLDTTKKSDWGTFGDFIGGTLNPIFALFSLFAIIYTIKIQTQELEFSREELEETRKELKESRIAQQEQSESLKLQNNATNLQIFENTLFQLNNLFLSKKESLKKTSYFPFDGNREYWGNEALREYLEEYKTYDTYDEFHSKYESEIGIYFSQIYQILKFINDSYLEKKLDNPERYISIFRAQFTKIELELLFYHCLGNIGKRKFKALVENYEFFEHISLNYKIEKQLLEYDIKAFGKNEKILEIYSKLKNKN